MDEDARGVFRIFGILLVIVVVFLLLLPEKSMFASAEFPTSMSPDEVTKLYETTSAQIWTEMEAKTSEAHKAGDMKKAEEISKAGHQALSELTQRYTSYSYNHGK